MKMTIGEFLFLRLRQLGVNHVFGVPGDFNLQLLEQIKHVDNIEFVGTCNELNAAYAADGYARLNGMGAVLTTYGVGDLSAVCGIAGSCAEHVPVVSISGTPPLYAMESRLRVHHSLAEGNFDNMLNCFHEFTVNAVRLTPANAVDELDRVLMSCWREKLPVYIQVPSNISYLEVEVPANVLARKLPPSDAERLESAAQHIAGLLAKAANPGLIVDIDAHRSGLIQGLTELARKRQIPYVAFRSGKGVLSEADPLFMGIISGDMSEAKVKDLISNSDCLIATAPCFAEASPMVSPKGLFINGHVYIRGFAVMVEGEVYEGVVAAELLERLVELVDERPAQTALTAAPNLKTHQSGNPLTQAYLWSALEAFFREDDIICVENGTSLNAIANVRLPAGATLVAQPIWGAIGYTLPALLGTMLAADTRRQILLIGDGSFQLTAQELSTILNRGLKPIIFLLNNRGYTIERYILGADAAYNDVANWQYLQLPKVFAPKTQVYTAAVATEDELVKALAEAENSPHACFIELRLDPMDAPAFLKYFGPLTAELDYGPRGPQHAQPD